MSWIRTSQPCLYCGGSRSYAYGETHEVCFKCWHRIDYSRNSLVMLDKNVTIRTINWDGTLPFDYSKDIPIEFARYIGQYLNKEVHIKSYGYSETINRLVFPVYYNEELKCWQGRSLNQEPKWLTISPSYSWGYKFPFVSSTSDKYVIVEDIISALKISEIFPAIALLGSSPNQKLINFLLTKATDFILWLDHDEAGRKCTSKLLKEMGMSANIKIIDTELDPKCYSVSKIEEILT